MHACTTRSLGRTRAAALYRALALFFRDFRPYYGTRDATRVGQRSMAIGINRRYSVPTVTVNMRLMRKPGVAELIDAIDNILEAIDPTFTYTSIQINENFPGNLHVDRSNAGDSRMLVVGDATLEGGELWCGGAILSTRDKIIAFDGNVPHMTMPYTGAVRYSVVLFTYAQICRNGGDGSALRRARALGIRSPARPDHVCKSLRRLPPKSELLGDARAQIEQSFDRIRARCKVKLGSSRAFERELRRRMETGRA